MAFVATDDLSFVDGPEADLTVPGAGYKVLWIDKIDWWDCRRVLVNPDRVELPIEGVDLAVPDSCEDEGTVLISIDFDAVDFFLENVNSVKVGVLAVF